MIIQMYKYGSNDPVASFVSIYHICMDKRMLTIGFSLPSKHHKGNKLSRI